MIRSILTKLLLVALLVVACFPAIASAEGWEDPNPPTLSSVTVSPSVASVGDEVTITWDAHDADGISSETVYISRNNPADIVPGDTSGSALVGLPCRGDPQGKCTFNISSAEEPGKRWVVGIEIYDRAGYVTTIWDESYAAKMGYDGSTAGMSNAVYEVVAPSDRPVYGTLDGEGSVFSSDSTEGLTFRFDAPFEKFVSLEIDGVSVPSNHYSVAKGSTIVTISSAYLRTISSGDHVVVANYSDNGRAFASFSVKHANDVDNVSGPAGEDGANGAEGDTSIDADAPVGAIGGSIQNTTNVGGDAVKDPTVMAQTGDNSIPVIVSFAIALIALTLLVFSASKRRDAKVS